MDIFEESMMNLFVLFMHFIEKGYIMVKFKRTIKTY